jgi:hypothetical protein
MARCVQAAHLRLHNQPIDDQTFAALYTMRAQHRAAAPRRQIAPLTPTNGEEKEEVNGPDSNGSIQRRNDP